MKRVMYAAVLVAGCTVAASAQAGMGADKMGQDKMMGKDAEKSVMMSGCVAESGGKFMLNNAMMMSDKTMGDKMTPAAPGAGSAGTGATGAGMAMGSGAMMMSYELTGGTLKPHVGHKVEVTGMMKPMMAKEGMAKEGMAKEGMAKEGMMKKDMMGGTVAVTNLKMIAATCS